MRLFKSAFVLSFMTLVLLSCNPAPVTEYYSNPVIQGDMADPSILRIGETYYATGTSSEWAPFYPVFRSDDLVNWEQTGHIFNQKPEWTSSSFWAPELYYLNGKVYCYYTARRKSDNVSYIGVATANSPTDEFTDHGLLIEYGTEAIDAFVFDDDGQLYISWKAYGLDNRPIELIGSKLSPDGLKLEGEPFTLLVDDENIGMEGQYHFRQGDYYYIVYSSRSCCGPRSDYDVCVARSRSFEGPYEKFSGNPILHGGEDFISSGHGTAIVTPDERMFFMCHAYLNGDGFYQGRQPILQEMAVNKEGWVYFVSGDEAKITQPMPFPGTVQKAPVDIESPYKWWTWNYPYSNVEIQQNGPKVTLTGTPEISNLYGSVACVRSTSPNYSYETKIDNKSASFQGLTMYGDDTNLIVWGVDGDQAVLKLVINGEETLWAEHSVSGPVFLKVDVMKGCMIDCLISHDGKQWEKVTDAPVDAGNLVRWDRVARPGLIHIGDKDKPAVFEYFRLYNK